MTKTRVLIAEDDAPMRHALGELVASSPTLELVATAANADEAIELAEATCPDVAVVDVSMPGGGGQRVARELRARSSPTRVVALSGYDDSETKLDMILSGAVGYLVKGGQTTGILDAIERAAGGQAVLSVEVTVDMIDALAAAEVARHQSEEALRRSEARFRRLLELSPDAVVVFDAAGRIHLANSRTGELFGYKAEDLLGTPVACLFADGEHLAVDALVASLAGPGQAPTAHFGTEELVCRRQDGSEFPAEMALSRVEHKEEPLLIGDIRDVTFRKEAEEATVVGRVAEAANRAKNRFLSRMSHELRTPLNSILGFSQLLEMDGLAPSQADSVHQILKAGEHLLALIDEVLDIARIEAGEMETSLELVSVQDAIAESLGLIEPLATGGGVSLKVEVADGAAGNVRADRQRIRQVLLNLLSNAVKYNRPGGSVTVACGPADEKHTRIEIRDTGVGLDPQHAQRLFTPFDRLGAEESGVEGTGLGLALTKHLVEVMNATIGVESERGVGTTVWTEWEIAADESPSLASAEPGRELAPASGTDVAPATVIYIEDNLSNLRLVERILERRPHVRLVSAMKARLGLELAAQHDPDLVLLDLNLPDMSGAEVLAQLRREPATRDVPVFIVSADALELRRENLAAAGANGFFTKPIDVKAFLEAVDEVLG